MRRASSGRPEQRRLSQARRGPAAQRAGAAGNSRSRVADSSSTRRSAAATARRVMATASGLTEIDVMPSRTSRSAYSGLVDGACPQTDDRAARRMRGARAGHARRCVA
jgi:hypothetical protein